MDRRVKERLVGATILVVLIVLIVPELLSGPKRTAYPPLSENLPAATRNVSVDLATSKATPAPAADEPASAASAGPPGGDTPGGDTPGGDTTPSGIPPSGVARGGDTPGTAAPPAEPTLRAQDVSPALETQPSSPKLSSEPVESVRPQGRRVWAVQLGSFASKANAEKLVHQLKASGSSVYVVSSGAGPSLRFRVRVGPLPDRDSAERAMLKLKGAGHAGTIVPPA